MPINYPLIESLMLIMKISLMLIMKIVYKFRFISIFRSWKINGY